MGKKKTQKNTDKACHSLRKLITAALWGSDLLLLDSCVRDVEASDFPIQNILFADWW